MTRWHFNIRHINKRDRTYKARAGVHRMQDSDCVCWVFFSLRSNVSLSSIHSSLEPCMLNIRYSSDKPTEISHLQSNEPIAFENTIISTPREFFENTLHFKLSDEFPTREDLVQICPSGSISLSELDSHLNDKEAYQGWFPLIP